LRGLAIVGKPVENRKPLDFEIGASPSLSWSVEFSHSLIVQGKIGAKTPLRDHRCRRKGLSEI